MTFFIFPPPAPTVLPVSGGGLFPVRRIYCVGQNYADHAREMGSDPTREPPFFFSKPTDAATASPRIPYPAKTERLDHEGELVVAIGLAGSDIPAAEARSHIYAYSAGCDLTRRDLQAKAKEKRQPWDMAKGFDWAAPIGVLHPASEIGHPERGAITLLVNDQERQSGDLSQMIWSVPEIIAALSGFVRLLPGDLIFTGTPAGVGPLERGDKVEVRVAGVTSHFFNLV